MGNCKSKVAVPPQDADEISPTVPRFSPPPPPPQDIINSAPPRERISLSDGENSSTGVVNSTPSQESNTVHDELPPHQMDCQIVSIPPSLEISQDDTDRCNDVTESEEDEIPQHNNLNISQLKPNLEDQQEGGITSEFESWLQDRAVKVFSNMQRGLVYAAPYNCFVMFGNLLDYNNRDKKFPLSREKLGSLMRELREIIHSEHGKSHSSIVVGVSFDLWKYWTDEIPTGMHFNYPVNSNEGQFTPDVMKRSESVFSDDGGALWFTIKSNCKKNVEGLMESLAKKMKENDLKMIGIPDYTFSRSSAIPDTEIDNENGTILGCRFSESLQNPSSPIEVLDQTLVGGTDGTGGGGDATSPEPNEDHHGASFAFVQRFQLNWDFLHGVGDSVMEDMLGRKQYTDEFLQSPETDSHIKCSHVADDDGDAIRILRLGQPFGQSARSNNPHNRLLGHTLSDEEGLFFVGLARSADRIETILRSQTGLTTPGFFRDRLLSSAVSATSGGFYYMPSVKDLETERNSDVETYLMTRRYIDKGMKRFPGVDWSRLPRHFLVEKKTRNPWIHYNHHEYMYDMSTASAAHANVINPPSTRILLLAARVFSRWQDSWYVGREQEEMKDLLFYAKDFFKSHLEEAKDIAEQLNNCSGNVIDDAVMVIQNAPIVIRKAWAVRLACGQVFVSEEYGIRGATNRKEAENDHTGRTKLLYGADTYHIHPLEIIVGAMPNLSLGSGKFMIDYANPEEKWTNFLSGFSYVSGVGHIVPGYDEILEKGTRAVREEIEMKRDNVSGSDKESRRIRNFYHASSLAIIGIEEHLNAYRNLVNRHLNRFLAIPGCADSPEEKNLKILNEMLEHLEQGRAPRNIREAAQLIFTLHSCLHLIGEPVAVGRLDQMLGRFLTSAVSDYEAQEVVDAFFLKLSEKTTFNRQFFVDHQPPGHLAMGNASGPYPQGANLNQWVQQLTVGGQDDNGNPAYNKITLFCLRASRRLHLNAPTISLRLYKIDEASKSEIFDQVIEEAAKTLLSGGAMPVLLNDDKIIPGLQKSSVRTSNQQECPPEVAIEHARNYACDGCYEPMFVGRNWFQLGGFPVLQALEYALNEGRDMLSTGPVFLEGKTSSFRSEPVENIACYEELEQLFFSHFEWTYAQQASTFVGKFGTLAETCPAPLLSVFVEGCMENALDMYAGGATYSVVGPCFTGIPDLVNSLWAIRTLCFGKDGRNEGSLTSLPELVRCLKCNWGRNMTDPVFMPRLGEARLKTIADNFDTLRKLALSLPRFGRGEKEIDAFGNRICEQISEISYRLFADAPQKFTGLKDSFLDLNENHPKMGIVCLQPGIGTFEGYLNNGMRCAASADGRLLSSTLATDLSPAPTPSDLSPVPETSIRYGNAAGIISSMETMTGSSTVFWNGSPVDKNISENFRKADLIKVIRAFADGIGGNTMTITVADEATFHAAVEQPERFDMVRVRMGGWTEFFACLPEAHKQIHIRRPRDLNDLHERKSSCPFRPSSSS